MAIICSLYDYLVIMAVSSTSSLSFWFGKIELRVFPAQLAMAL